MRVHLAEDSRLVRQRLREGIAEIDSMIQVTESETAGEAIVRIEEESPDVVVLDLNLGKSSGLEVLKEMRRQKLEVTVLVFTNHAEEIYRKRCLAMGVAHFFDKLKDFEKLIETIGVCMKERGR
ncbi:MAG: response regulator transcription factor [Burkholderiales bacterium]|nr:response regulator transcription factor [Burkholderiales bacterium]